MKLFGPVVIKTDGKTDKLVSVFKQYDYKPIVFDAMTLNSPAASRLASHIKVLRMIPDGFDAIWICEENCEIIANKQEVNKVVESFLKGSGEGIYLAYNVLKSTEFDNNFNQLLGSSLVISYIVKKSTVDELIKVYGAAYRSIITEQPNVFLTEYKNLDLPQRGIDMNSVERSIHVIMDKTCWLIPKNPLFVSSAKVNNK
jgi:hypothetical protein